MVTVDNLADKLCALVLGENLEGEVKEWRLLGQEQDGTLLFTWIESGPDSPPKSHIGLYDYANNKLEKVYSFDRPVGTIQASINVNRTMLGYIVKEKGENDKFLYRPVLVKLDGEKKQLCETSIERTKQIMIQFLYHKQSVLNEKQNEKFLLFIHEESILQYQINPNVDFVLENFTVESMVHSFIWAQWDHTHQTLYYIHYRKPIKSLVEGEEPEGSSYKISPTLSGLQFHDDLPHESVLNIPLNLPHLSSLSASCGIYEDDTIPLRIHDCSLDLIVLTDSAGIVCICHHYLYQPIHSNEKLHDDDNIPVHFAYSVTVLHHSCVIHCVVPGIPWKQAKAIRPLFQLYDEHILVFIPGICTHLLDTGFTHDPTCHIMTTGNVESLNLHQICLAPLNKLREHSVLNLPTLDIVDLTVPISQLVQTFKSETTLENRLSILHYLLVHKGDVDTVVELLSHQIEQQSSGLPQMFREFLIGTSYASVQRNLPSDASQLINLLPITTQPTGCDMEVSINHKSITISQDALWNASMMLLSPQQRIVPYRADIWVKLWEQLVKNAKGKLKFKPSQVVEKLLVSLVCYQPEALSRSSTPMSPVGSMSLSTSSLPKDLSLIKNPIDALPFYEIENCTASKQEHIISVNLRELSMHLLKQSTENKMSRFQWQSQTPMHVHAVATRYIAAQLEQSRFLCQVVCKTTTMEARYDEKGFVFIEQLPEELRFVLFITLEQYYLAVESIAFPLPQGFMSFFTYLGYKTLSFNMFLQYVQRHVFELQVDVMKIILAGLAAFPSGDRLSPLDTFLDLLTAKASLNELDFGLLIEATVTSTEDFL